nr:MAG TPA: hypothetical protein [Caudoviricetes sp.]
MSRTHGVRFFFYCNLLAVSERGARVSQQFNQFIS